MPKKRTSMNINRMNKVLREQRLEREKLVGRPRAKTIDSRPDAKKDRKNWRKDVDG